MKKIVPVKRKRGRPKQIKGRVLYKKMFLIDGKSSEILRNVCHEQRISFSELIRKMIEYMIEKRLTYFKSVNENWK